MRTTCDWSEEMAASREPDGHITGEFIDFLTKILSGEDLTFLINEDEAWEAFVEEAGLSRDILVAKSEERVPVSLPLTPAVNEGRLQISPRIENVHDKS